RDAGRHGAELQGRDIQIALPNPGVERFTVEPWHMVVLQFPCPPGYDTGLLARKLDSRLCAQTYEMSRRLDPVDAESAGALVEKDIARNFDGTRQVDPTVAALLPAMKLMIAEGNRTAAMHLKILEPRIHGRKRHGGLDGRARRIKARQRLVDQRRMVIRCPRLPLRVADADIEQIRIERRSRSQSKDVSVARIHNDSRRTLLSQSAGNKFLQILIECQINIRAGLAGFAAQFPDDPPIRIDLHTAHARLAADIGFEFLFDAPLADAETRQLKQRIGIGDLVLRGDGRHITEYMREFVPERVGARLANI